MRAVHSYRVRIRLNKLIIYSRISLLQLADYLRYTRGLAVLYRGPPEWRPEAEILMIEEEDGLAAVEPPGWPQRTDRA